MMTPASVALFGGLLAYNLRFGLALVWEPLPAEGAKMRRLGLQAEEAEHSCLQFALRLSSASALLSPGDKTPREKSCVRVESLV